MFHIYRMVFLALKRFKWLKSLLDRFSSPDVKVPLFIKIFHSLPGRGDSPYPFNAIWKNLACFTYQSRGVEIISTHFSVWLRTVTQFNISKSEISLKVLLFIGNGFLIPTWKYWILISKNESILRTNKCKRMTYVRPHFPAILETNQQWAEMM